jgi:AmmeMemoRadiSam system protein B
VAAEGFAGVRRLARQIRRAIIIGPSHFVPFRSIAAPSHSAFATPLGEMPVAADAVAALSADSLLVIDDGPHAPDHAIEVELPFLQALFEGLPIVPLLFGSTTAETVAAAIDRVWDDDSLLVVSSDLSHFEDYEAACTHDARTAAAIESFSEAMIGPADACGHLAIRGALKEAARRGLAIERFSLPIPAIRWRSAQRGRVWRLGLLRASQLTSDRNVFQ